MDNPFISVRKYIKWGDEPRGEDTNTFVLTTRSKHYIDIRILSTFPSQALPNDPTDPSLTAYLQWAFAGTCSSTPAKLSPLGETLKPAHTVWNHWIDSNHPFGNEDEKEGKREGEGKVKREGGTDEGDMYPQSDGTVLEYGEMLNPNTGMVEKYEECWEDVETCLVGEEEEFVSWVLICNTSVPSKTSNSLIRFNTSNSPNSCDTPNPSSTRPTSNNKTATKGIIIRIGQIIQGLIISNEKASIVRWEWKAGDENWEWERTLAIGRVEVPGVLFEDEGGLREGEELMGSDGLDWACVEAFEWA